MAEFTIRPLRDLSYLNYARCLLEREPAYILVIQSFVEVPDNDAKKLNVTV